MKNLAILSRFKNLSEISRDVAQVFFASVVISPLIAGAGQENIIMIAMGMMGSIIFWWFSLFFAEKGKL